jgi:hypothetical protein
VSLQKADAERFLADVGRRAPDFGEDVDEHVRHRDAARQREPAAPGETVEEVEAPAEEVDGGQRDGNDHGDDLDGRRRCVSAHRVRLWAPGINGSGRSGRTAPDAPAAPVHTPGRIYDFAQCWEYDRGRSGLVRVRSA